MDKNRQETAIKQAIDKLRNKVIPPRSNVGVGIAMAIDILVELLPVEEKQIEDAWKDGLETSHPDHTAKEYYNQTYRNATRTPT